MSRKQISLIAAVVVAIAGALLTAAAAVAEENPNTPESVLVGSGITLLVAGGTYALAYALTS